MTPRTQDEIVSRINKVKLLDTLGFEWHEYVLYLDFKHAKLFLESDTTKRDWLELTISIKPEHRIKEYMPFAFEKAYSQRGISANRSIGHIIAWSWLAGEDELTAKIEHMYEHDYRDYGLPILEMVCDHFGWDSQELKK